MRDLSWLDNLTLKASYGVQGNEGILDSSGYDNFYGRATTTSTRRGPTTVSPWRSSRTPA